MRLWTSLTCVLAFLAAFPWPARLRAAPTEDWEVVTESLRYRRIRHRPDAAAYPVVIHAFRFSLADFEVRALSAAETSGGAHVRALVADTPAVLAVNGSFFLEDRTPLGLVVSEGREMSPLRRVDWGIFAVAEGGARVVHRRDWAPPRGLEFAVQSGPRLVVAGKPLTFKPQRARRTALGIADNGDILVIATEGALYTTEFADFLVRPESAGGLGCRDALNLDGGSSTQLWFAAGERRVEVSALSRVANAVAIFPRGASRPKIPALGDVQ